MIGPHEGQELELMLSGQKPMAAFGDIKPENGEIDEIIIPEKTFAPYVQKGEIIKVKETWKSPKGIFVLVCYALPDEKWRAQTYIWLRKQIHQKELPYTDELDIIFGRLLGYSDEDIYDFCQSAF